MPEVSRDDGEKVVLVVVEVKEAWVEKRGNQWMQDRTGWCWRHSHEQAERSEHQQEAYVVVKVRMEVEQLHV